MQDIPRIWIFDSALESLSHGRDLSIPGIIKGTDFNQGDLIAILSQNGKLVALGTALLSSDDVQKNEKGIVIKTSKVFYEA